MEPAGNQPPRRVICPPAPVERADLTWEVLPMAQTTLDLERERKSDLYGVSDHDGGF